MRGQQQEYPYGELAGLNPFEEQLQQNARGAGMTRAEQARRRLFADGMTPQQQRRAVVLAQDVLKWLRAGRLQPQSMMYVNFGCATEKGPLQPQLKRLASKAAPCDVCAEGALFIAHVDLFNEVSVDRAPSTVIDNGVRRDTLLKTFSRTNLAHIESAFECWDVNVNRVYNSGPPYTLLRTAARYCWLRWRWGLRRIDTPEAAAFGRQFPDARRRMRAIMQNIIDNRGVFVPPPVAPEPEVSNA